MDALLRMKDAVDEALDGFGLLSAEHGNCLARSFVFMELAWQNGWHKLGTRLQLQAGSASWQFRHLEPDDPGHDAMSYVWEVSDTTKAMVAGFQLPEVHVWLADADAMEVIDPSAGEFKTVSETRGYDWTEPDPPTIYRASAGIEQRGSQCIYEPDTDALKTAMLLGRILCAQHGIKVSWGSMMGLPADLCVVPCPDFMGKDRYANAEAGRVTFMSARGAERFLADGTKWLMAGQ